MADINTKLHSDQGNGGASSVSISEIAALVTVGVKAAAVANCVPAADGTSAGTQLNALLVSMRNSGLLAP